VSEIWNKYGENLYLICGAACLALAVLGIFGAMFVSIKFALFYFVLVAIPILVGLLGAVSGSKIFTVLVVFGCATTIVYVLSIYFRDVLYSPSSRSSFIHEPGGWVYLSLNSMQIFFAATRLRHPLIEME
jgi:hypothetical protein